MNTRYTKVGNYFVRRPHATRVGPERVNVQDIVEIVGGVFIFGSLFLGIPFLLWLVAS